MARAQAGALGLAALAGASMWISLGTLAVTTEGAVRVGAVAPIWIALVAMVLAIVAALAVRLPTASAWPLALCGLLWLPWIPGSIPEIFLVFEGPVETVVWLAVVVGLIVGIAGDRGWTTVDVKEHAAPYAGGVAFAAFLAAAGMLSDRLPAGDEPNYLIITQSLLRDGDLRIENNHDRGDYLEYIDRGLLPDFLARGTDGEIYSVHAPGVSALLVPAFALGGYPGAVVFTALVCACAWMLMWRSAFRLGGAAAASVAWAAVVFSPTLFFHSFAIFPDGIGAAVVAVLVWWLVQAEFSAMAGGKHAGVLLALLLSLLPWLHTRFALIAGVAGIIVAGRLWLRADRMRSLATFAAVAVIALMGWLLFFWSIYGAPDPTAPYGSSRQTNVAWIGRGLVGIFFDQQFGLVTNAPIMAMVPYALIRMWGTYRRLAIELSVLGVPYLFAVAAFAMWWGGESAPARFLGGLIPIAIPVLAFLWTVAGSGTRSLMLILTVVGVANTVARTVLENGALLFNFRDGRDRLLDWLSPTVDLTLGLPSVHRDGPAIAAGMAVIWIASFAIVGWALHRSSGVRTWTGRSYTMTAATVLLLSIVAFLASARVAGQTSLVTPETSGLHFIERWRHDQHGMLIDLSSIARVQPADAIARMRIVGSPRPFGDPEKTSPTIIRRVPAGTYRLVFDGSRPAEGAVSAYVGSGGVPIESWDASRLGAAEELDFSLPTDVQQLVLRRAPTAAAQVGRIGLQPVAVARPVGPRIAMRGARYGTVRLFLFDDQIFEEPGGLWTRGDSATQFLLASDDGQAVEVSVRAGAAAVRLEIDHSGSRESFELQPGALQRVRLPGASAVGVRTVGAFRPRDVEPRSEDGRLLGVRIEFDR